MNDWQSPVSVAPMIRCTDRHFRYLMRLLSPSVRLYTEMITADAIVHGDADRLLAYDLCELPLVVQLAGSAPDALVQAAHRCVSAGLTAINLNVGCPSERVQSGRFGVCLMKDTPLVARCLQAMQEAVSIPVTLKTRIGVDEHDSEAFFFDFMGAMHEVGCRTWIIHARKAWLKGLSPKENRDVPPLNYDRVYRLKQQYPDAHITINGGIQNVEAVQAHLERVDAVMLGRAVAQNPFILTALDQALGCPAARVSRRSVAMAYQTYMCDQLSQGVRLGILIAPLLGLYHGQPGGRQWRRTLTERGCVADADATVVDEALRWVD